MPRLCYLPAQLRRADPPLGLRAGTTPIAEGDQYTDGTHQDPPICSPFIVGMLPYLLRPELADLDGGADPEPSAQTCDGALDAPVLLHSVGTAFLTSAVLDEQGIPTSTADELRGWLQADPSGQAGWASGV
jgi:hypothetical protein